MVSVLLNTRQAAERCNLSPRTLEKRRVTGGGPLYIRLGSAVRYRLEAGAAHDQGQVVAGRRLAQDLQIPQGGVVGHLIRNEGLELPVGGEADHLPGRLQHVPQEELPATRHGWPRHPPQALPRASEPSPSRDRPVASVGPRART
jgi:hypothetical protein